MTIPADRLDQIVHRFAEIEARLASGTLEGEAFVAASRDYAELEPIARAAEGAGHSVAFGCAPSMRSMVEAADFAAFALGTEASSPRERLSLRPVDRERESRDLRERFARRAARYRAPLTMALCKEWKPDALVCDETDFGAIVAAERL